MSSPLQVQQALLELVHRLASLLNFCQSVFCLREAPSLGIASLLCWVVRGSLHCIQLLLPSQGDA